MNRVLLDAFAARQLAAAGVLLRARRRRSFACACGSRRRSRSTHFVKLFSEGAEDLRRTCCRCRSRTWPRRWGASAFSYEELPVILLMGLWTVTRGSDCLAGRVGSGHDGDAAGPAAAADRAGDVAQRGDAGRRGACWRLASLAGLAAGLAMSEFDPPPALASLVPATAQLPRPGRVPRWAPRRSSRPWRARGRRRWRR